MEKLIVTLPRPSGNVARFLLGLMITVTANIAVAELPIPCGACNGGVWVSGGQATLRQSANLLNIDQATERAILNWESFNVGPSDAVRFNQPNSSSIALNRIFQADPSRILGSVTANGQVMLINQNGILFGAGAQIDTHSLIASTLPVSDNVFNNLGLIGAINSQEAAFEGSSNAAITIEQGAEINAQTDGRVLIIAADVENRGKISTPEGQTILAGSTDKVYLEASDDPNIRGLFVEVETGGSVSNVGEIIAERGNATLLGAAVNQNGRIQATTSESRNGTIRLLAQDDAQPTTIPASSFGTAIAQRTGTVTLGRNSVTEITIEQSDATAPDAQSQPESQVEIVGEDITLESNARISAIGGSVSITATQNPQDPLLDALPANDSQVVLQSGSSIDVSGSESANVDFSRNMVEVDLRGNELRDNPVNRDGPIRGETVVVDARRGTAFADVEAFISSTEKTADERLAAGGSITIRSEGSIDIQPNAELDISGGVVNVSAGVNTASYLTREGGLTHISDADPNVLYDGVFNFVERDYEKWSVTETFFPFRTDALWLQEPAYQEGAAAGELNLVARNLSFNGRLVAETTAGINQRFADSSNAFEIIPNGGRLILGDTNSSTDFKLGDVLIGDPTPGFTGTVIDPRSLLSAGLAELSIFANGDITVTAGQALEMPALGKFSARAATVEIGRDISIPAGDIDITAGTTITNAIVGRGAVVLLDGIALDVSGNWINDLQDIANGNPLSPVLTNGGSISLAADGLIEVPANSELRALGGGYLDEAGTLSPGTGGDVTLSASAEGFAAELRLAGKISGFSLGTAGTLSITAPGIVFGNTPIDGFTTLDSALFVETGFSAYQFEASSLGVQVNSDLDLTRYNLVFDSDFGAVPTGADLLDHTSIGQLEIVERDPLNFSVNSNRTIETQPGGVAIAPGVRITADPNAQIDFFSDTSLFFDGKIIAPGANVSFTTQRFEEIEIGFFDTQQLWFGPTSVIDVSGTFLALPTADGFRDGLAVAAGEIDINANRGFLIAEPGSRFALNGASGTIDILDSSGLLPRYQGEQIGSNAGTLNLTSGDGIFFAGSVEMAAAVPGAQAGNLNVEIDPLARGIRTVLPGFGDDFPLVANEVRVGAVFPAADLMRGGPVDPDLFGVTILDQAVYASSSADTITLRAAALGEENTGLTSGATGRITFEADTKLTANRRITFDAPEISLRNADAVLTAPIIELGPKNQIFRFDTPLALGTGTLRTISQSTIVHGALTINGAKPTGNNSPISISASDSILFSGTPLASDPADLKGGINTASDLRLSAAALYPATLSDISVNVTRTGGQLVINGRDKGITPFSIAGSIKFTADQIIQNGVIKSPYGTIQFEGESITFGSGSLTSVGGENSRFLYGSTEFDLDWVVPLQSFNLILDGAPQGRIEIEGEKIIVGSGATIDLSGNGDLQSFEFTPGPGGSFDFLDAENAGDRFAIISSASLQSLDPVVGFDTENLGSTVVLTDNELIPAGEYLVLPARYALLPGAYLLDPAPELGIASPNTTLTGVDGLPVISGKFSFLGTDIEDPTFTSFSVLNGVEVRRRSEYVENLASQFFGPSNNLPADNGFFSVNAGSELRLLGEVIANGTGRQASIGLIATELAIVDRLGVGSPTAVEILASDISNFSEGSVVIGGSLNGNAYDISSNIVSISPDATLTSDEIVILANNSINVGENASLRSAASKSGNTIQRVVNGDGAVVIASDNDVEFSRAGASGIAGAINIAAGAELGARGSIVVDASTDTVFAGEFAATDASVSLGGSSISVGEVPVATPGFVISEAALAGLSGARALRLRSASTIDLFGNSELAVGDLNIDALGARALAAAGDVFTVNSNTVTFQNSSGTAGTSNPGVGQLVLNAEQILFGDGEFVFDGFDSVRMTASNVDWRGDALQRFSNDLVLNAGVFRPAVFGNLDLVAAGNAVIGTGSVGEENLEASLGSSFSLTAQSIAFSSALELPSGNALLNATGGELVLQNANINLAGLLRRFQSQNLGTPGGQLELQALGNLTISNSALNVSGGTPGVSGSIAIRDAANASVANSNLIANGLGTFTMNADSTILSALLATLGSGFTDKLAIRLRSDPIDIPDGTSLIANEINLTSDSGPISIGGSLTVDGAGSGGHIRLFSGGDLIIQDTATLSARGSNGAGGLIELGTNDTGNTLMIGTAIFDLAGNNGDNGTVRIRAPVIGGGTDVAATPILADFQNVSDLEIEAYQVSNGTVAAAISGLGTLGSNLSAIANNLNVNGLSFARVVPGAELQLSGPFVSNSELDLIGNRFGGVPGILTLRSDGDITLNHSVSDGMVDYEPFPGITQPRQTAASTDSWSLRYVAGADLASADPLATVIGQGDFTFNDTHLRTGTGTIEISAGGDLNLSGQDSGIYTVGLNRGTGAWGQLITEAYTESEFLHEGGSIWIAVAGDINSTERNQLPNDWLARFEGEDSLLGSGNFAIGWGIQIDRFGEGVGALGGGNIHISAGGDVSGLGVAAPTNALPVGPQGSEPEIAGGGSIQIQTGGDFLGGGLYAADGDINLDIGGAVTPLAGSERSLSISLGDATTKIRAREGIEILSITDPFLIPISDVQAGTLVGGGPAAMVLDTFFIGYSPDARAEFESLAGSIRFETDVEGFDDISPLVNLTSGTEDISATILPAFLSATAFSDSIEFSRSLRMLPSPQGDLRLFAEKNISTSSSTDARVFVNMSNADPTRLPAAAMPDVGLENIIDAVGQFDNPLGTSHAEIPVHINSDSPIQIISNDGLIGATSTFDLTLTLPKQTNLFAGRSIQSLNLLVQHANDSDLSVIRSGGDIVYPSPRNDRGVISTAAVGEISVAGPGTMAVIADTNIDLGTAAGITSVGDTRNTFLPDEGANLIVIPGFAGETDNEGFANHLLQTDPAYAQQIADYVRANGGDPSSNGLDGFLGLGEDAQRTLLIDLFFQELVISGVDATSTGSDDYSRGFAATEAFFAGENYDGDLSLILSRIATIDGGDINILVPGGMINAGVAASSQINKNADELGIVAQRSGDIKIFVRDDLLVNQSRVSPLDGGDIVIWSSDGDIDAGRGAKSAVSIPSLTTTIDANGNVVTEFPPAIQGSGIRAAVATQGRDPGDVFLFAPRGAVIAGDAGIGSAGNLTIGATEVVGADNIDVGGVSVGVPSADVGSVAAGLTGASDSSAAAANQAQDGAGSGVADSEDSIGEALAQGALSFISVEVLGFGG